MTFGDKRHSKTLTRLLGMVLLIGTVLALGACGPDEFLIRRDMYYNVGRSPKVRLKVDWLSEFGYRPSGMTVLMDGVNGNRAGETTASVDSVDLRVDADIYPTLVYNLSSDEFGSMDFHNDDSFDSIYATLTPLEDYTNGKWDEGVTYMRQPEDLGVATDTITITDEMVDDYSELVRYRLGHGIMGDRADTVLYVFYETPKPVVSTLHVYVHIGGIYNAASCSARLDGMADGYRLSRYQATEGTGSHMLQGWSFARDSVGSHSGWMTTTIKTFALPHPTEDTEGRDSTLNHLTLHFNLVDGETTRTYKMKVGNLFQYLTEVDGKKYITRQKTRELQLVIYSDIDLPDVDPNGDNTSAGFDAVVDEWEKGPDTDVTF